MNLASCLDIQDRLQLVGWLPARDNDGAYHLISMHQLEFANARQGVAKVQGGDDSGGLSGDLECTGTL